MSTDLFFEGIRHIISKYEKRQPVELGFNAFALVSDQYRKENFHSDILRGILDPSSPHGAHCLFLKLFFDFLIKAIENKQSNNRVRLLESLNAIELSDSIKVIREEARTDIAIVDEESRWVIIVENKINGAFDMPRQLPRYYGIWKNKKGLSVKAIVYLCAESRGYPDTAEWSEEEKKTIDELLIPIIGYSEKEPNLVTDWLGRCILSTDSFDAKAVLSQYSKILIKQAGETTMIEMSEFAEAMWKAEVSFPNLQEFVSRYPIWLAEEILRELSAPIENSPLKRIEPFSKVRLYPPRTVVLDGLQEVSEDGVMCNFSIDIRCDSSLISLSLFIREYDRSFQNPVDRFNKGEIFRRLVSVMERFGLSYVNGWRWERQFELPGSRKELDGMVNNIVNNLLIPINEQR